MGRAVLMACVPWLALLAVSLLVLYVLIRASRAKVDLRRLPRLHGDQLGSAQTLSFVLTLPLFVMVILFIVQVSQLMIATIVVHYAAVATARAATVWIPAGLPAPEGPNCISMYYPDPEGTDQSPPVLDPESAGYGPSAGGMTFVVEPGSAKYDKIASAAVMACMPISPSRDVGAKLSGQGSMAADIIKAAYSALAPASQTNAATAKRIENKLAYAMANTAVEIRFRHKNSEPPLGTYFIGDDIGEFRYNEIGWQDQITVTVKHNLALLPGPGRLLARHVAGPPGASDNVSGNVTNQDRVYTVPLSASAVIGNEGEKPVIPYVYQIY